MSNIKLAHIYKDYIEGQHVVRDFNLDIKDGEFIVLVGPSGCGKSTTLRMIAGLEDITSGELYFEDKLMNDVHPKDRDIAMVFQNYALYPHMTVAENMGFGLKMQNKSQDEIDKTVKKTAEIIGLTDYLDRLPKELSGGQRQRVALGRAISRKSKVFLMDEPLSNLDAKLRVQTRSEISNISKEFGNTTIYVTHDQVEAMTMADRIVLMKDGVIQQVSTPKDIYLYPNNIFVAGFMGSPAMNFIPATLTEEGLKTSEQIIKLNDTILTQLAFKGYMNKEIIFGIRPENIVLARDLDPENDRYVQFSTKVRLAEMLGSETLIHFMVDNKNIIAKVNTLDEFSRNQDLNLAFDLDFANFFDKDSTDRIVLDNEKNYQNIVKEGGSASGKSDEQLDQSNQSDRTHSQTHSFQASK
ncbi:ABC transporter ATP-binding protein [Anaerococcus sp. mt242]|uniref:ABC transporter ATP-binding protein n=1 Tax=Anaerococcus sp. mt242 TaxID=2661917 RepID=UPI001932534A|nr:ABC transporter ATP-binding protein [Anaerococcus sp. mt242]MBM0046156.1 ABC transporter ATP-binding protein [Anaerococcus sp. mt242]